MGHLEIFNGGPFFSQFKMMVLGTIAATQDCNPPFLFHGRHQKGGPQGSFGRTIDADIIAGDHQDGRHAFVHFFRRHFGNQSGCIARSTMDCFLSFCFCYAVVPCGLFMELWYDRRQTRIFKVQECGVWRKSLTVEYKCNGKLYSIVDGSIHWKQCVHTVLQNSPLLSSQWAVYPA